MVEEYTKGHNVQFNQYFGSKEFDCHCRYDDCDVTYIDSDLIDYLTKKRVEIGKPFHIQSGFRCTRHNRNVGGKPGSIHLQGKAADIFVDGEDMFKLADRFEDAGGLGRYPGRHFLHCDIRPKKARWTS